MVRRTITDILLSSKLVSDEQLNDALNRQKQLNSKDSIGDILVGMGIISEKDKVRCLGEQWGVSFVDLSDYKVNLDTVKKLSQDMARRFQAIPINQTNGKITIAMKNPLDIFAIDEIRLITGLDIDPVIATEDDLTNAINEYYRSETTDSVDTAVDDVIKDINTSDILFESISDNEDDEVNIEQLRELSEEAPIVRLVNLIINKAIQDKASDIHVESAKDKVRIRYRIDGILHDALIAPKKVQASLVSRIKIMADMDIAEKRAPQDGRISLMVEGKQYDLRVSTLPNIHGEKVVMRILDKSAINVGMHRLGFSPGVLELFENTILRTYGIILVTGPTGSGKSTTLYSVLNKLNSGEKNILTIEDPVEYELPGITQSQVNPKAGMTFANGLRTALRQDPNIIMVGEIRDKETAVIAIEAALTGHLVLATLHTNDAPGAVARITDMGVESFLTASAVIGVLAQRLLRSICSKCKESYEPSAEAVKRLGMPLDSSITFYRGHGCDYCKGTGYKGRIGVFEYMPIDDDIRELILAKASTFQLRQCAIQNGMKTLKDDAMEKILLGITTLEEALRVIYSG